MLSNRVQTAAKARICNQQIKMSKESKDQSKDASIAPKAEDFGYLNIPQTFVDHGWPQQEGFKEKFIRKTKENPFVPLGLGVTTFALTFGLWQLKTGDRAMSQRMMRLRVGAQGFTVVALLAGVYYNMYKTKKERAAAAAATAILEQNATAKG